MKIGKTFDTLGTVKYKFPFFLITVLLLTTMFAQEPSADSGVWMHGKLHQTKGFSYRLMQTQYLTNENNFFLDVTADTFYLKFLATDRKGEFLMNYSKKDHELVRKNMYDTFRYFDYHVKFDSLGRITQLTNWKFFRDMIVKNLSDQVKVGLITSETFETSMKSFNDEATVMRAVMQDIIYLFENLGSYYAYNAQTLTLKPLKSPFSGYDLLVGGNVIVEPSGTDNVILKTSHKTSTKDEQVLIAEYKGMMVAKGAKPSEIVELNKATLNSEYQFYYHLQNKLITYAKMSDIFAVNLSSKGNVRDYLLWDIVVN